ncbi:hypothetical protein E2493_03185 [Sphingomonas parva]|uniref:Uncharacterized protein n=1 Tax=Sphingomonas parva TaxID=2555898 RepID=A0A4Y8ZWJ8_9SPHN|nr:hypothetical protein [Sphingomonas parva]TFI59847.1 hypothetical protein E2493_03185 [Sphingomonas parva]
MRLDQQNRGSCLFLLTVLAALIGLVVWMSLGGVGSQSPANDMKAGVAPPASPTTPAPAPVR